MNRKGSFGFKRRIDHPPEGIEEVTICTSLMGGTCVGWWATTLTHTKHKLQWSVFY